jgi:hypothetical protein
MRVRLRDLQLPLHVGAVRRRRFSAVQFPFAGGVRPLESPNAFVRSSAGHSVRKRLIKLVTYGQPTLAAPRIRSLAPVMPAPTNTIA